MQGNDGTKKLEPLECRRLHLGRLRSLCNRALISYRLITHLESLTSHHCAPSIPQPTFKCLFKKLRKSKKPKDQSLNPTDDTLGSNPEPTTSASAITTSAADPIPSVLVSTATVNVQVIQATDFTVSVQLS